MKTSPSADSYSIFISRSQYVINCKNISQSKTKTIIKKAMNMICKVQENEALAY